ncbi:COG3014 family protein [Shewanella maritima]|uniref:COG3014 family protein n=1 Tax=Shewanella maritima TaxID=2520507 RepID=UPI003736EC4C
MKKMWAVLVCSITLTGCAMNSVFINYPSQIAPYKQQLNQSKTGIPVNNISDKIDGNDGLLYAQEAGRIAQIDGDFDASKTYYQQAMAAYRLFDDRAVISASDISASASSILLNDNAIPYRGPGYERIMLHQYQAMNYLMSGDPQGALVEVRRSNQLQASEERRYRKSQESVKQMANGTISTEVNRLGKASGTVTSSFLNAYSFYTTGLLHELLGEPNDAYIDYRKAAQITPNNTYLQQDLVRLAKQLSMPQYQEFKKRWGEATTMQEGQGQVVFVVEKGFAPVKQSFTVPFTINGNIQTASLATYPGQSQSMTNSNIQGLGTVLRTEPIANIDALAYNALKEELPAALVRQAARVYAKAEMNRKVAGEHGNHNNDFGAIAMQIFNVITEQADRRSWLTLPQEAQIARKFVDAGQYNIQLRPGTATEIEVQPNRATLIWVIETGNQSRFYSIII